MDDKFKNLLGEFGKFTLPKIEPVIPAYEILDPNRKNIIHQKKFLMKIVMNLTVLTFQIGNAKYVESKSKKGTFGIISGMEEMKQNQ